jgi:hypothetical protein
MTRRFAPWVLLTSFLISPLALAANFSMGVEVTEHSNLRKTASSSAEIVSELPAGAQLIADPVSIETPDDPECKQWLAVQYQMATSVTLEGFVCESLTRTT